FPTRRSSDLIVLQVLVAAVAVGEEAPLRVPLANPAADREESRGALEVERLVVLHDADGGADVDLHRRDFDRFEVEAEVEAVEERSRLREVLSAARRKGERLEPRRRQAE